MSVRSMLRDLIVRSVARGPDGLRQEVIREIFRVDPDQVLAALGPMFNREPELDTTPFDLEPASELRFEDFAGFFASNSLNHGLIGATVRQAAYLYGLTERLAARKAIETGRFRGGSTLLLAAAMQGKGKLWSIDIGEKEERFRGAAAGGRRTWDEQIRSFCDRYGLDVEIIVGDSKTVEIDTGGDVDLVFIDGDHSYEGALNDFERFGRRVRIGGVVIFDDYANETYFSTPDTVGLAVDEAIKDGDYRLVKVVDRLAHLQRVR